LAELYNDVPVHIFVDSRDRSVDTELYRHWTISCHTIDTGIRCTSGYYHTLKPIIVAWLLIAVILIPVLITSFLLYHRHHIVNASHSAVSDRHNHVSDGALNTPLITVNTPLSSAMERWIVLYEPFDTIHWYTIIWLIVLLVDVQYWWHYYSYH
jgi:hypothetical protein